MPSGVRYSPLEEDTHKDSVDGQLRHSSNDDEPRWKPPLRPLYAYLLLLYLVISSTIIILLLGIVFTKVKTELDACLTKKPYLTALGKHYELMSVDHRYDMLWEDIEHDADVINITESNSQGSESAASIAMFHQLHCLKAFRHVIQLAREGITPGLDNNDDHHWPHCFDYMRMTVLCWADDTIERQSYHANGTRASFIDGAFDLRQCGDNRKLIQLMKDGGRTVNTRPFP